MYVPSPLPRETRMGERGYPLPAVHCRLQHVERLFSGVVVLPRLSPCARYKKPWYFLWIPGAPPVVEECHRILTDR